MRLYRIVFIVAALWCMAMCGVAAAPLRVVTTAPDLADITRSIGGSRVTVESIASGRQDYHQVEARPSYMTKVRKADMFVQIGGSLEAAWAPAILDGSGNTKVLPGTPGFVDASRGLGLIEVPSTVDRKMGDVHAEGNPHYLLDPDYALLAGKNILAGLKRIDPDGSATYDANYNAWRDQVQAATKRWESELKPLRGMKVVTYHRSWSYFLRRFGMQGIDEVENLPGITPTPGHLAKLVSRIKAEGVKLILIEPHYASNNYAATVANESGAKLLSLANQVGAEPSLKTYIEMMDNVVRVLRAEAK